MAFGEVILYVDESPLKKGIINKKEWRTKTHKPNCLSPINCPNISLICGMSLYGVTYFELHDSA